MPVDVESELARLGAAWSESVVHVDVAEVLERAMTTRVQPGHDVVDAPAKSPRRRRRRHDPGPRTSGQRWLVAAACVALVVAGALAVAWRSPDVPRSIATDPTTPPSTPVIGPDPVTEATIAAQQAVVEALLDALNRAAVDGTDDLTPVRDLFTDDATVRAFRNWDPSPVTEPGFLERWTLQLKSWGFDGVIPRDGAGCLPSEDVEQVVAACFLHVRWANLLAEASDVWYVEFAGDRIRALQIGDSETSGLERDDATLPLAVADLAEWEQWLRETDPETAAGLLPETQFAADPVVTRYDPALAAEISASVQRFVANRPSGDEITVTTDLVEVGDRLVAVDMASADGRTYVLAGRYQTARELEIGLADRAVLAAFAADGGELWRTDLDGYPSTIAVADDLVWVGYSSSAAVGGESLTGIDISDGRVIDHIAIDPMADMVGGFGSLWVLESSGQLVRVGPDLSMTVAASFPVLASDGCDCAEGLASGSDAIWVPLDGSGVAAVDAATLTVTTIPREEIGHAVTQLAFDGDVAYVASRDRVSSIDEGQVRATVSVGEISYLGPVEGALGVLTTSGVFRVLQADDPMVVERRSTSRPAWFDIAGEAWSRVWDGRKADFRRVELLPLAG